MHQSTDAWTYAGVRNGFTLVQGEPGCGGRLQVVPRHKQALGDVRRESQGPLLHFFKVENFLSAAVELSAKVGTKVEITDIIGLLQTQSFTSWSKNRKFSLGCRDNFLFCRPKYTRDEFKTISFVSECLNLLALATFL